MSQSSLNDKPAKRWTYREFAIYEFKKLDSTNRFASELARRNELASHDVIVSHSQTAGSGKSERRWESPPGNLYFSIVLTPNVTPDVVPQISLLSAVALCNSIERICGENNIQLVIKNKWPNDVMVNDKKIAGILSESILHSCNGKEGGIVKLVIVGIGINITCSPITLRDKACSLEEFGIKISNEQMLRQFLSDFISLYENWLSFGFTKTRNLWLSRAYEFMRPVTRNVPGVIDNDDITGIFSDIDEMGNMILSTKDGSKICCTE